MKHRHVAFLLAFLLGFLLGAAVPVRGASLVVDLRGGGDHTRIQPAIDAARDGDTVLVRPGEYVIDAPVVIPAKLVSLVGEAGAAATIIRMSDTPSDPERTGILVLEGPVAISDETGLPVAAADTRIIAGLTLTGGRGTRHEYERFGETRVVVGGGALLGIRAAPTIRDCVIRGNSTDGDGGGLLFRQGEPLLEDCEISGNSAAWGGGVGCEFASELTLLRCRIAGNSARRGGGGAFRETDTALRDCSVVGNSAVREGGGLLAEPGSFAPDLRVVGTTISGNQAERGALSTATNEWPSRTPSSAGTPRSREARSSATRPRSRSPAPRSPTTRPGSAGS